MFVEMQFSNPELEESIRKIQTALGVIQHEYRKLGVLTATEVEGTENADSGN